jgi:hypothetical protein
MNSDAKRLAAAKVLALTRPSPPETARAEADAWELVELLVEIVLDELAARVGKEDPPKSAPFWDSSAIEEGTKDA